MVPAPLFLVMILKWISERVGLRRMSPCGQAAPSGGVTFRGDAKAEGVKVVVAGWRPVLDCHGVISKCSSPWFMVKLTPVTPPLGL